MLYGTCTLKNVDKPITRLTHKPNEMGKHCNVFQKSGNSNETLRPTNLYQGMTLCALQVHGDN
jgi:hypothetical protein